MRQLARWRSEGILFKAEKRESAKTPEAEPVMTYSRNLEKASVAEMSLRRPVWLKWGELGGEL